jgi:hypothetical protein
VRAFYPGSVKGGPCREALRPRNTQPSSPPNLPHLRGPSGPLRTSGRPSATARLPSDRSAAGREGRNCPRPESRERYPLVGSVVVRSSRKAPGLLAPPPGPLRVYGSPPSPPAPKPKAWQARDWRRVPAFAKLSTNTPRAHGRAKFRPGGPRVFRFCRRKYPVPLLYRRFRTARQEAPPWVIQSGTDFSRGPPPPHSESFTWEFPSGNGFYPSSGPGISGPPPQLRKQAANVPAVPPSPRTWGPGPLYCSATFAVALCRARPFPSGPRPPLRGALAAWFFGKISRNTGPAPADGVLLRPPSPGPPNVVQSSCSLTRPHPPRLREGRGSVGAFPGFLHPHSGPPPWGERGSPKPLPVQDPDRWVFKVTCPSPLVAAAPTTFGPRYDGATTAKNENPFGARPPRPPLVNGGGSTPGFFPPLQKTPLPTHVTLTRTSAVVGK